MADKRNNRRNNKDYDDDYRIKKIRKKLVLYVLIKI